MMLKLNQSLVNILAKPFLTLGLSEEEETISIQFAQSSLLVTQIGKEVKSSVVNKINAKRQAGWAKHNKNLKGEGSGEWE